MKTAFRHLFTPTKIGRVELRNRLAMAPMGVELCEADGVVREPTVAYYAERARGGAGLLITENTAAAYPWGANSLHEIAVSDDRYLPGFRQLTRAVQAHGAKIAIQLAHHGKIARTDIAQGRPLILPSEPRHHVDNRGLAELTKEELALMMRANTGLVPRVRAATKEDLERMILAFASAARRAREGGFDAVELHAAHGYIFSEFLSPSWNFREDEYGGPIENRARLLCEVIRACKRSAGDDYTIWCRIDSHEFGEPYGITLPDAIAAAKLAEAAGADAIHVSAYAANAMSHHFTDASLPHKEAAYVENAAAIKAAVSIPVIAVGRIEPELAEELVASGRADVVSMARKMLADPEIARKLAEGRRQDVRPCIYCYVCVAQPFFDLPVRCAVNPVAGKETALAERVRTPAARKQKVLVVGGGPAGMEAARVAALRGHAVTLVEQGSQLGGTLRFAALAYEPNERLLRWYEAQMNALPVDVRLGVGADAALVRALAPDVVISATGAAHPRPQIPGAERDHVFDGDDLRALLTGAGGDGASAKLSLVGRLAVRAGRLTGMTDDPSKLREASKLYMPLGQRVVVIGGGLVGCELAEFLAERGRDVTVIEEGPVAAKEMAHPRRWRVLFELRELGVRLALNARVLAIDEEEVRFETAPKAGEPTLEERVAADSVVLATGLAPDPAPAEALRAAGVPVVEVGDAKGVGYIEGAVHSGFHAALAIGNGD